MTRRAIRLLVIGAVLIGAALFGALFLKTHERADREVYVGLRGEARVNPFLAAEQMLVELGLYADELETDWMPDWLPDRSDTLVLGNGSQVYSDADADALLTWAQEGGHLVITAPYPGEDPTSPLLAALDMTVTEATRDADDTVDDGGEADHGDDTGLTLCFHYDARLEPGDPEPWDTLSDDAGILGATRSYGDGLVTVLAEATPLTNDHIGFDDNADFVYELITSRGEPDTVWFVHRLETAPLWAQIWRAAWPVVIGLALLAMAFLASRGGRFGPLIPTPPRPRRSLDEHVDACGRYLYRVGQSDSLVGSVRDRVVRRVTRGLHGATQARTDELADLIAAHSGRDRRAIAAMLDAPDVDSHRRFTEQVADLKALWKSL